MARLASIEVRAGETTTVSLELEVEGKEPGDELRVSGDAVSVKVEALDSFDTEAQRDAVLRLWRRARQVYATLGEP